MGLFDDAKKKAKELAGGHEDQVDQGLDKAADYADDKTGGKYSDQIDSGKDKASEYLTGDQDNKDT